MKLKVKKRPIVVEAVHWTGDNLEEVKAFLGDRFIETGMYAEDFNLTPYFKIKTLEGDMGVVLGSYIICGAEGEFWAIKESIFEKTYEQAKEYVEYKADDMDVMAVEELVGMGCGAWDTINPKDIIDAAYMVINNKANK